MLTNTVFLRVIGILEQKKLIRPEKYQVTKNKIMKKIIITLSLAGFISLGFTVVENNTSSKEESARAEQNTVSEKYNGSNDFNDKRLASWD